MLSVSVGVISALLIVAQAWLLADVVAKAFIGGRSLGQLATPMDILLVVVLARAAVAWGAELAASRASAQAKSQLRSALIARLPDLGCDSSRDRHTGELAVLATRGIDALDGYFSLYLPQLFLAVIVPIVVLVAVLSSDWPSAVIIAFTVPLIPLFMALVGAATRERMDRRFRTLQRLADHFLDVVAGLPTLKVFGRAKAQVAVIREITERYRTTAMSTLRITFLSSLILELVATIAVALVAVSIGLRLMGGHLDLRVALFVLVLAPEAFMPLRQLGANYHVSAEGMAAVEQVFTVLQTPDVPSGIRDGAPDPALVDIEIERLRLTYPERDEPALEDVSLTIHAGELLALVGPSGCGKSTLLSVLLGLLEPESGSVRIGGIELAQLDLAGWRQRLAWVPQRPHLFNASVAQNVRIGRSTASDQEVWAAISGAGLADVIGNLPHGIDTMLGDHGSGLSAGERQRLALARAFVRDAPLLLLDEPTAGLDGHTELQIIRAIRRLARGRTVVIAAHRPALVAIADRVLPLAAAEVVA